MEENKYSNLVLFDGVCNLCNSFVQFFIKYDADKKFKFSSLQSSFSRDLTGDKFSELNEMKTIAYLRHGSMLTRSTAALYIFKDLGGWRSLVFGFIIVPPFIRDLFYDWLSARRYKFFGRREECMVPDKELEGRFL